MFDLVLWFVALSRAVMADSSRRFVRVGGGGDGDRTCPGAAAATTGVGAAAGAVAGSVGKRSAIEVETADCRSWGRPKCVAEPDLCYCSSSCWLGQEGQRQRQPIGPTARDSLVEFGPSFAGS